MAGDQKYGDKKANQYFRDRYQLKYQLLHSRRIVFPKDCGRLKALEGRTVTAPVPGLFGQVLQGEKIDITRRNEIL